MTFLYLKALHIIFVVTWFAGLFYIIRIFIYQTEANDKDEPARTILLEEYKRNAKRLWLGIAWPSAILTLVLGTLVLLQVPSYLSQGFMHIKLTLVLLLYVYHFICHRIYKQLQQGVFSYKSQGLRIWNEVATLFLVGIVFLIVLKNALSMIWGIIGLVLFAIILMIAIRIYKKIREKDEK